MNTDKPLWTCPDCGKKFVTKNMWHSCTKYSVDDFFINRNPHLKNLFEKYLAFVEKVCGEKVLVNVDKTRISFQARTRFTGVAGTTKDELICGLWLKHRINSPRFTKIERITPHDYVYRFKVKDEADLDAEVAGWIKEAYKVGSQQEGYNAKKHD